MIDNFPLTKKIRGNIKCLALNRPSLVNKKLITTSSFIISKMSFKAMHTQTRFTCIIEKQLSVEEFITPTRQISGVNLTAFRWWTDKDLDGLPNLMQTFFFSPIFVNKTFSL